MGKLLIFSHCQQLRQNTNLNVIPKSLLWRREQIHLLIWSQLTAQVISQPTILSSTLNLQDIQNTRPSLQKRILYVCLFNCSLMLLVKKFWAPYFDWNPKENVSILRLFEKASSSISWAGSWLHGPITGHCSLLDQLQLPLSHHQVLLKALALGPTLNCYNLFSALPNAASERFSEYKCAHHCCCPSLPFLQYYLF